MKVRICPNCKHIFVYRRWQACAKCKQPIKYDGEFVGKGDHYKGALGDLTYEELLKKL